MRKHNYLRYRRLLSITKEILRVIMMVIAIIIVIKSI